MAIENMTLNQSPQTFEEWAHGTEGHPHSTSSNILDHLQDAWDAGVASQQVELNDWRNKAFERLYEPMAPDQIDFWQQKLEEKDREIERLKQIPIDVAEYRDAKRYEAVVEAARAVIRLDPRDMWHTAESVNLRTALAALDGK